MTRAEWKSSDKQFANMFTEYLHEMQQVQIQ